MKIGNVKGMSAEFVKDYLIDLIIALDRLDEEDFFGTEGWRHFIMGED